MTRVIFFFLNVIYFSQSLPSTLSWLWISLHNLFILFVYHRVFSFLWSKSQVWHVYPSLLELFFFYHIHPLILGLLGIKFRNLFWLVVHEVILIPWLESWILQVNQGWVGSIQNISIYFLKKMFSIYSLICFIYFLLIVNFFCTKEHVNNAFIYFI